MTVPPGVDLTEPVLEDSRRLHKTFRSIETLMVVLDTCAMIWLFEQQPMTRESLEAIRQAAQADQVLVSPVSAWEIGMLASRRADRTRFQPSPWIWFDDALGLAGVRLTDLAPYAAIEAAFLPGEIDGDPADLSDRHGTRSRRAAGDA